MASTENPKELIKKSFETREGVYRISEYIEGQPRQTFGRGSFPQQSEGNNNNTAPVRISFSRMSLSCEESDSLAEMLEHICFNYGRELHFMPFSLFKTHSPDSETTKMYKGTIPTCHDVLIPNRHDATVLAATIRNKTEMQQLNGGGGAFHHNGNSTNIAPNGFQQQSSLHLEQSQARFFVLVGFGAGQIQLFEASKPQQYVFFNESRATDSSKVSSIKWVPHSSTKFLAAHVSGHIYLYDTTIPCDHQKPAFVQLKSHTVGFSNGAPINGGGSNSVVVMSVNKNKGENPTHRLSLRTGCVNHIAFSPCGYYLALACQDGFLRVYRWTTVQGEASSAASISGGSSPVPFSSSSINLELCVAVRSFFGGFLCVAWSPDGRYLATGGEDDLVTLVSFNDNRVVCRGRGHKSWITSVAFDFYACVCGSLPPAAFASCSSSTGNPTMVLGSTPLSKVNKRPSAGTGGVVKTQPILYRLASVGQDTCLCLWELTEDVLVTSQQQLIQRQRLRSRSSLLVSAPVPPSVSVLSPQGSVGGSGVINSARSLANGENCTSTVISINNPVKTDPSNILGPLTLASAGANTVLAPLEVEVANKNSHDALFEVHNEGQQHLLTPRSPSTSGRGTPSPSSTVGSASGTTITGSLASKLAFWHRDKYKMNSKHGKSHKRSKEKRGSLTSTVSAISHVDHGQGHLEGPADSATGNNQVRTSLSEMSNGLSNGSIVAMGVGSPTNQPSVTSPPMLPSGPSLLGTIACPRLTDVPVIEPIIVKKIAADPLTGVAFLKDCILTACQAGYLAVWSRPNVSKENTNVNNNGGVAAKTSFDKQASTTSSNIGCIDRDVSSVL